MVGRTNPFESYTGHLVLFGYPCDPDGDECYCGFFDRLDDTTFFVKRSPLILPCNVRAAKRCPSLLWVTIEELLANSSLEHIPRTSFERDRLMVLDLFSFESIIDP